VLGAVVTADHGTPRYSDSLPDRCRVSTIRIRAPGVSPL
jgi:hypothetical protein